MRRKIVVMVLTIGMSMSMTMSALANSSTTDNNSSRNPEDSRIRMIDNDEEEETEEETNEDEEITMTVKQAAEEADPGEIIDYEMVHIAVADTNGRVMTNTLEDVVQKVKTTISQSIDAIVQTAQSQLEGIIEEEESEEQISEIIQELLTTPPSRLFVKTVTVLVQTKGEDMVVNYCGTVKTAATAKDAKGNTIASAGVIANVTTKAYMILIGYHEDGTIEYVEGIVDPITGMVLGVFQETPDLISILVLA